MSGMMNSLCVCGKKERRRLERLSIENFEARKSLWQTYPRQQAIIVSEVNLGVTGVICSTNANMVANTEEHPGRREER